MALVIFANYLRYLTFLLSTPGIGRFPSYPLAISYFNASYDIVKLDEYFAAIPVSPCMTSVLLESLEALLSVKRQRLTITHSPRSREVLRRQIKSIRDQISAIAKNVAH